MVSKRFHLSVLNCPQLRSCCNCDDRSCALKVLCVIELSTLTGNDGKPLSEAEMFDPAANTWTALPNMSVPLCSCSFTTFDGRLNVIGGLTIGGPSASLQVLSLN